MARLGEINLEGDSGHLSDHNQLAEKANYVFDVKDFGATGDGETDDTTAVAAAVAAAITATPATVYFPKGTFYLAHASTSFDVVGSNITLLGAGPNESIVKVNPVRNIGISLQGDDIHVKNLGFLGTPSIGVVYVEYGGVSRSRNSIEGCHFAGDGAGYGVYVQGGGKVGTTIANNLFTGAAGGVQLVNEQYQTTIRGNTFTGWANGGIILTGAAGTQAHSHETSIIDNRFWSPDETGGAASVTYPIHTAGAGGYHKNLIVSRNYVQGTDKEYGADTGTPDQLSFNYVRGLIVTDNVSFDGGDMGITLEPTVSDFVVSGNYCKNNDVSGIWCGGVDGVIANNFCVDNGQDRSADAYTYALAGISLHTTADHVAVYGNMCTDSQGTKTQLYGLNTYVGAANIQVGVNDFSGNGTANYFDAASIIPDIDGARNDPEAALASLLTMLETLGLLTDSTTAS